MTARIVRREIRRVFSEIRPQLTDIERVIVRDVLKREVTEVPKAEEVGSA